MPEQETTTKKTGTAPMYVTAVAAIVFGFIGGVIGADARVRTKLLQVVAPSIVMDGETVAAPTSVPPTDAPLTDEERVVAAVEKAAPAVVSIVVTKDMPVYEQYQDPTSDFFNQFFGGGFSFNRPQVRQNGTEKREVGAGTGFIADAEGYIVTNKHVVGDESAEYTVILQDGTKFDAKVLARDTANDIAVIKIEKKDGVDFPFIPMGDVADVRVGQRAIAIGYALGKYAGSVSTGIVSGLGRTIDAGDGRSISERLFGVIQTDAAINPGNSGGPLLDSDGKAIGVNVAIVQGSQSIGFALPIDEIRSAVESVKKDGKISRPYLGVRYAMIDEAAQKKNQLPVDRGAVVVRGEAQDDFAVVPGSPADIAGIVENDIILEVDGVELTVDMPLAAAMAKKKVGDIVTLKVLRKGTEMTVHVSLVERKQ